MFSILCTDIKGPKFLERSFYFIGCTILWKLAKLGTLLNKMEGLENTWTILYGVKLGNIWTREKLSSVLQYTALTIDFNSKDLPRSYLMIYVSILSKWTFGTFLKVFRSAWQWYLQRGTLIFKKSLDEHCPTVSFH